MRNANLNWKGMRNLKETSRRSPNERGVNAACWKRLQKFVRRGWWIMKVNEDALNKV